MAGTDPPARFGCPAHGESGGPGWEGGRLELPGITAAARWATQRTRPPQTETSLIRCSRIGKDRWANHCSPFRGTAPLHPCASDSGAGGRSRLFRPLSGHHRRPRRSSRHFCECVPSWRVMVQNASSGRHGNPDGPCRSSCIGRHLHRAFPFEYAVSVRVEYESVKQKVLAGLWICDERQIATAVERQVRELRKCSCRPAGCSSPARRRRALAPSAGCRPA